MPDNNGSIYIGLMSGTSMDGIDAAAMRFSDNSCDLIATHQHPYPAELRNALVAASRNPRACSVDLLGGLDQEVGECFRDAVMQVIRIAKIDPATVAAIGSHGQTLRHRPDAEKPFTLQIGDPNVIAAGTGITTVADFRRRDVAEGGQGAPLAPAFHHWLFSDSKDARVLANIGGIANVTCLPIAGPVTGFDCGPGNTLLDAWNLQHRGTQFDADGKWSVEGSVDEALLEDLLADRYFSQAPPKSTGFEYFNLRWLDHVLSGHRSTPPGNVQSTLCELTACAIADSIRNHFGTAKEVIVCGGGVHNRDLMSRLGNRVFPAVLHTTAVYGLDPDWVEAAAFGWLAMRTLQGQPGNIASVTGAARPAVLGGIYSA